MSRCVHCNQENEKVYEMGSHRPIWLGCACVPDSGVSDEEFESYRKQIIADMKVEKKIAAKARRWRWSGTLSTGPK